jgi:hypothetical protein
MIPTNERSRPRRRAFSKVIASGVIALGLVALTACGSDDDETPTDTVTPDAPLSPTDTLSPNDTSGDTVTSDSITEDSNPPIEAPSETTSTS